MSTSPPIVMRSPPPPRPTTMASYQSSSPRLPSPLNPYPSFSPPLTSLCTPDNSPAGEMSDTLSPLRERPSLDQGLTSPAIAQRPRASSFSRSPLVNNSPEMGCAPLQQHRAYIRHPSPCSSPFAQGIPFPSSSPLSSSSPLAGTGQPQSPTPCPALPVGSRPHSPVTTQRQQDSPASIHSSRSQFQSHPLRSPPRPSTPSHFRLSQGSPPLQILHARTQSLIQQSCGSPHNAQVTSPSPSPDDPRHHRRVSLSTESPRPHSSVAESSRNPTPADGRSVGDNSTPLNEAPVRWWGGRQGWADDWDGLVGLQYQYQATLRAPERDQLDGMLFVHPSNGSPLVSREPFRRGRAGSGPFLDDEIRASFEGDGFMAPLTPDVFHAQMHINTVGCEMKGIPIPRVVPVPVPMPLGNARSTIWNDDVGFSKVNINIGSPPNDEGLAMKHTPNDLTHLHAQGSDGATHSQGQEPRHEHAAGRKRGFSDASTHSTNSYTSCASGPSQSQSRSVLLSPSESHASASPSLASLGIGIEGAEREELRSRSFWRRRNSGSTIKRQSKDLGCGHGDDHGREGRSPTVVRDGDKVGCECSTEHQDRDSKLCSRLAHEKITPKHGSMFFRGGSKQGDSLEETAQREGYNRAEKYVSLAITSILTAATITMLSPVGDALVKARESAKFVGHEIAPVVKDTLAVSTDILALAPLPGLEEAAKALLSVWNACQKVETNRLSCLRLAERSAALLYSVRQEIDEAGVETAMALDEPVERLCGALAQIRAFLETQLRRPFLKRYVRREEIARELVACNEAITDAASRFGISVQIRTYHVVCAAAYESKRFAQEIHALLTLDQEMIRRHSAMMYGQSLQAWRREAVSVTGFSNENALGLVADGMPIGAPRHLDGPTSEEGYGGERGRSGYLTPPPAYGLPSQPLLTAAGKLMSSEYEFESAQNTPALSASSTGYGSDVAEPSVSVPPTPTPTRATFVAEETRAMAANTATATVELDPTSPMRALAQMHLAQDSVDAAADEVSLQGTLAGALNARNDVEMIRCLQVGRGEIPEAAETLRRMLGASASASAQVEMADGDKDDNHRVNALEGGIGGAADVGSMELHRKFMQSGIEAMTRLASVVAKEQRGESEDEAVSATELPNWTITRYEVVRTRKISVGFFSDVYIGRWQDRLVVIKVLAHSLSRESFVRHIEGWNALDHPNVLPLYGASSAMGEKPWFFVSKFCSGGNLIAWLKRARVEAGVEGEAMTPVRVDLLRCMRDIAQGMSYLHARGVLHGDLRAANVLVDENGRCVLSDFGQHEIKAEAHRSCGQPEHRKPQWESPEILEGSDRQTKASDVYAFAMCCVEIFSMGDLPWATLNEKAIRELVLDKDERPPIPVFAGNAEVAEAVGNLVRSCWVREPDRRPSFASVAGSLEEITGLQGYGSPQIRGRQHPATPQANSGGSATVPPSVESSPADEQYETASESMMTEVEEDLGGMTDIPLTSPIPGVALEHVDVVGSVVRMDANDHASTLVEVTTQVSSIVLETRGEESCELSPTNEASANAMNEEQYRLLMGSRHAFHSSLTLALWSPTRVELGAVGYLAKPRGEFVALFNAMDPLESNEEQLRHLPSMYGYGKFEIQKREDGKRSMTQRGLDAISGFLTFKTRNDRSHSERIARQCAFPLMKGKPAAHLYVEKTVHRYVDPLEAPTTWFSQHVDHILEVYGPRYGLQREDLILVVGTLDAPDWALFVSEDHSDGRVQFNVFAGRERGEPWGVHTMERAVKGGSTAGPVRYVDVGQGMFTSKVSSGGGGGAVNGQGGHCDDDAGDTVMLAVLRFERGMQTPTVM